MNETASKFLDKYAVLKLLEENLENVVHIPRGYETVSAKTLFDDFDMLPGTPDVGFEVHSGIKYLIFNSPVHSAYPENDKVMTACYEVASAKGSIIFIHGLYNDKIDLFDVWIKTMNKRGLNVYAFQLPYHFDRTPAKSFGGEFFFSADLARSLLAIKQAVYDLYQLYTYVRNNHLHTVTITAFSIGGATAVNLLSLTPTIDNLVLVNPVCSFSRTIWEVTLCRTIKRDLINEGFEYRKIYDYFYHVDPVNLMSPHVNRDRILLITGNYDQINKQDYYDELYTNWHFNHVLKYKAGHLNIFQIPRLTTDIAGFHFRNDSL